LVTRAVFFDLGGTLMVMRRDAIVREVLLGEGKDVGLDDVHSAYMEVESWWLSKYGNRSLTPAETDAAYSVLNERIFEELLAHEGVRIYRSARERWAELERTVPYELYPDAEPALKRLGALGLTLGLISNAPSGVNDAIDSLGLRSLLDHIVISSEAGFTKPHPRIFQLALARAKVQPEASAHVGDIYEADVVGARNAGMRGILLDRNGDQDDHGCPTVASLSGLESVLDLAR
jgi:HAD superfamily hydrolase (TIGR01549 family)